MDTADTQTSFLSLPRELRDQIYDLSLQGQKEGALLARRITYRYYGATKELQLACRQIRNEILERNTSLGHVEIKIYRGAFSFDKDTLQLPVIMYNIQLLKLDLPVCCRMTCYPRTNPSLAIGCEAAKVFVQRWIFAATICKLVQNLKQIELAVSLAGHFRPGRCLDQIKILHDRLPRMPVDSVVFTVDKTDEWSDNPWFPRTIRRVYTQGSDGALKRNPGLGLYEDEGTPFAGDDAALQIVRDLRPYLLKLQQDHSFGPPLIEDN